MGKKSKMKVVLDTNVIISILLWKGKTRKILDLTQNGKVDIITSDKIITELKKVITYPKFLILVNQSNLTSGRLVRRYLESVKLVKDRYLLKIIEDDPSDNIVLSCALSAKADFIVSGDKHLLNLKKFQNIPILSPKEFIDLFELMTK